MVAGTEKYCRCIGKCSGIMMISWMLWSVLSKSSRVKTRILLRKINDR